MPHTYYIVVAVVILQSMHNRQPNMSSLQRRTFIFADTRLELFIYCDKNHQPWFKAKEIALFMGYQDSTQAIRAHIFSNNKIEWCKLTATDTSIPFNCQWPHAIFINEPGLYQLTMRSKLPSMLKFQVWVTSEVLPSIRRSGEYAVSDASNITRMLEIIERKDILIQIKDKEAARERNKMCEIITSKDRQMEKILPYVVKRPNDMTKSHQMCVYHKVLDNNTSSHRHEYHVFRRQRGSMKRIDKKNIEKTLIYTKDQPNAINAFNRVKDHLKEFVCFYNKIQCNDPPKEFINKLNLN